MAFECRSHDGWDGIARIHAGCGAYRVHFVCSVCTRPLRLFCWWLCAEVFVCWREAEGLRDRERLPFLLSAGRLAVAGSGQQGGRGFNLTHDHHTGVYLSWCAQAHRQDFQEFQGGGGSMSQRTVSNTPLCQKQKAKILAG